MKKARLADGSIVLAHQFDAKVHTGDLCCADPDCGARMTFRRETLTHGASAIRSASFVSKAVAEHNPLCTEYEDFKIMAQRRKSIEEGLKDGKTIVLNLNMKLSEAFNAAALPSDVIGMASTSEKGNYVTAAVKSVDDLLELRAVIEAKGGKPGLAKTVVNYKGKTLPIEEFVVDSQRKFGDLLDKMYKAVDKAKPGAEISEFPRLITFKATQNTKASEKGALRGTPITFYRDGGNKVILLQKALVKKEFEETLRGENVFIIAAPTLQVNEARRLLGRLRNEREQTMFLNMNWQVTGVHQFTPVEEAPAPKPVTKPAPPKPGQQSMF